MFCPKNPYRQTDKQTNIETEKLGNGENANKKPVKNKDLWIKLNDLCKKYKIDWKWIKGHSNNEYNDLADDLATRAIQD